MDLFNEKTASIMEKMWGVKNMHLEDKENFVYTISGVDCHGKEFIVCFFE